MSIRIKFWGVRGSIACSSASHVVYGGNTSCVEIDNGQDIIIFDAGTGLRLLGRDLQRRGISRAVLLLSHTHWDHIYGFPFFAPAYSPDGHFRVLSGHLEGGGLRAVLSSQMAYPLFPVPLSALPSTMQFEDITAGETLPGLVPGVTLRSCPLNHPDGATGYRLDFACGVSVAYITDTEHLPGQPNQAILDLIAGADLVIYDSTYTDAEFPAKVGWGHSTWQEGTRLCQAAGVRRLAIFHHDPDHDDSIMGQIEAEATSLWPQAFVARDEMELILRPAQP